MPRRPTKFVIRKDCALAQNVGTALAPDGRSILLHFELTAPTLTHFSRDGAGGANAGLRGRLR